MYKMAEKNIIWIVLIGIVVVLALGGMLQKNYNVFAITGNENLERNIPSSVQPGSSFNVVYQAVGISEKYGASIVDSVQGGCRFPAGITLKSVMLSSEGDTKTIRVTAPPSAGACTFSGDYKFGTSAIKDFPDGSVTISSSAPGGTGSGGEGTTGTTGTGTETETETDIPTFNLNMVLFKIGNFDVTIIILIITLVSLAFLSRIIGKR